MKNEAMIDAAADAETFRINILAAPLEVGLLLDVPTSEAADWGTRAQNAIFAWSPIGDGLDIYGEAMIRRSAQYATWAARAAFRAVPELKG